MKAIPEQVSPQDDDLRQPRESPIETVHRTLGASVKPRRVKALPKDEPDAPYVGLEHIEPHTMKLLGTVPAGTMKSSGNRFFVGDVLYSRLRPYLNKVWLADRNGICSGEFIVIPPPPDIDPAWLAYRLHSQDFVHFANSLNAGDRPRVDFDQLSSFPLLLPSSLATQREIVAKLDEQFSRLDAGVEALRRAQANLKRYRASVLKAACEGRLVPTEAELARQEGRTYETGEQLLARILEERRASWPGKGKYKEPAAPDITALPELPEGWAWATPAQLGEVQLGRQRSPKNISNEYPTKYIRAANITSQGLDLSDVLEMEFRPAERERFTLKPGDLVLSEASGSAAQVGKPAIWEEHHPPHCFQNTVIRLRPSMSLVPKYLLVVFKHYYVNGVFSRVAGGVGINHLSADKFASLVLALPPLAEQVRIVSEVERRFSVRDSLEDVLTAPLRRAARLREAELRAAFSPGHATDAGKQSLGGLFDA